jgi:signal peptidase II
MRRLTRFLLLAAVIVSCVGCDQTSKTLARRRLEGRPPVSWLGGVVQLMYVENPGAFLSLGAGLPAPVRTTAFVLVTTVLLIGVFRLVWRSSGLGAGKVLALGMLAAGGLGNLIDRIGGGGARDWILLQLGPAHTGVFNLADVAVSVSVVALFVATLAGRGAPEPATSHPAGDPAAPGLP